MSTTIHRHVVTASLLVQDAEMEKDSGCEGEAALFQLDPHPRLHKRSKPLNVQEGPWSSCDAHSVPGALHHLAG